MGERDVKQEEQDVVNEVTKYYDEWDIAKLHYTL